MIPAVQRFSRDITYTIVCNVCVSGYIDPVHWQVHCGYAAIRAWEIGTDRWHVVVCGAGWSHIKDPWSRDIDQCRVNIIAITSQFASVCTVRIHDPDVTAPRLWNIYDFITPDERWKLICRIIGDQGLVCAICIYLPDAKVAGLVRGVEQRAPVRIPDRSAFPCRAVHKLGCFDGDDSGCCWYAGRQHQHC